MFSVATGAPVLEWPYGGGYDVSPDGQRFLVVRAIETDEDIEIIVVQNWFSELERLVPVD